MNKRSPALTSEETTMTTEQTPPKTTNTQQPGPATPVTRMEAIRRAVAELGPAATGDKIQAFAKERFGLDLTRKYITDSRSKMRTRKKRKKSKPAAPAAPPPAAAKKTKPSPPARPAPARPAPARPAAQPGNGKTVVLLEDLVALRSLVERVGSARLRALLDVLGG
jgi:hypothetical protein